jgi:hypothetical protein
MFSKNLKTAITITLTCAVLLISCASNQNKTNKKDFPVLMGEYLGQQPPGLTPEIFAPEIISTGLYERDVAMTPDGTEFYYGLMFSNYATIMVTKLENGKWTEPHVVSFASDMKYFYFEPCITPGGKKFLFLSTRPPEGQEAKPGWTHQNIWAVDRQQDESWGEPYDIGSPINTEGGEYFPSVTNDGTLYFTRQPKGERKSYIYRSRLVNGKYEEPEKLPDVINNEGNLYNAFIAHDESYLIVPISGHKDALTPGAAEYFIFFRDEKDNWSKAINMGEEINRPGINAISPYVTRDGKYFFFGSHKRKEIIEMASPYITLSIIKKYDRMPLNGRSDIYWVDAKIIDKLKEE